MTAARLPTRAQGCAWAWPGLLSLRLASQQSAPPQRPSRAASAPVGWPGLPASPPPTALTEPPSPCLLPWPLPALLKLLHTPKPIHLGAQRNLPATGLPGALHGTCPAGAPQPPGSDLEGSGGPVGGSRQGGEERGSGGWLSTSSAAGQDLHPAAGGGAAVPARSRHPSPGHKGTWLPAAPSPGRSCWKPGA